MATRQVSTRNLVGRTSLSFIRPQRVSFSISGTKPQTRLYAFFDGVAVDAYVTPQGGSIGGVVTTNAAGSASGVFDIPAMTFNTGDRVLKFQDTPTFTAGSVPGSLTGSAAASFTAIGMQETYQTTINTINQIVVEIQQPNESGGGGGNVGDPLAQTFFTYGVTGGCFVTKIDLYFQSKDTAIPVTLELREVVNGYPSTTRVSSDAVVTLSPAQVNTSANASAITEFTFNRPIYLEENRDYCFVLLANSNSYHVWTSKLGETSIETGRSIFEQPFIGTLFKSENNITWTAEQTEDIKFTLYKAAFSTGTFETVYKATAQNTLTYGSFYSVTPGSAVVTCRFPYQHGHNTGDRIFLTGNTGGNYRGIPNATISDVAGFSMTVLDAYTVSFNVGANATSTGTLASSGILDRVDVDASGSGYVSPNISFSGGGGTGAAATAVVVGGRIVSVAVTSPGSGYTSTPVLNLTDAGGSGAILTPISETIFSVPLNRKYQYVVPVVVSGTPPSTEITNTIRPSTETYVVGTPIDAPLNQATNVNMLASVVNTSTETVNFGSTNSTQMTMRLTTDNANVSPMVDVNQVPAIRFHNMLVNSATNAASETSPTAGTALARYVSKQVTLATVSKDIRVIVEAASVNNTSFDVFVRTSISGAPTAHTAGNWVRLNCSTLTNTSRTWDEYKDYEFFTTAPLTPFDVYDIKIVMYSELKYLFPKIANYRAIVLAT